MFSIKVTFIFQQLFYKKGIFVVAWVRSKAKLPLNSQTHGLRYGMVQKKKPSWNLFEPYVLRRFELTHPLKVMPRLEETQCPQ